LNSASHDPGGAHLGKRSAFLLGVAVVLLAAAAHSSGLSNGFAPLDDALYVSSNLRVLGGLTWEGVRWAFSLHTGTYWHPLTWLSLMANAQVLGPGVWGFHAVNLALHAANVALLYGCLLAATRRPWPSALAAALLAAHPIHVEAVAWITSRKDVLGAFFFLLALLGHVRAVQGGRGWRVLSVAAFALAVMAKSATLTLPFVLLLLDWWPLGRLAGVSGRGARDAVAALLREKAAYALVLAAALALTLASNPLVGLASAREGVSLGLRLANLPVAYAIYLRKLFWPADLAFWYSFPLRIPLSQVLPALGLLGVVTAGAVMLARRAPSLLAGWLWFLGTLVPMSGLVQSGMWPALADRFAYLPFMGLYLAAAFALDGLLTARAARRLAFAGAAGVLAALVLACRIQAGVWADGEGLLRQAVRNWPENWQAVTLLAEELFQQRRSVESEQLYRQALAMNPGHVAAYNGLALALEAQGRSGEALEINREAVRRNPQDSTAHSNLGAFLLQHNATDQAEEALAQAARLDPTSPHPHLHLAGLRLLQGRVQEAGQEYVRALELDRNVPRARLGLGVIHLREGRLAEAERLFRQELYLSPNAPDLLANLGLCLVLQGRLAESLPFVSRVTSLQPGSAAAWSNLGMLLLRLGRGGEAQAVLEQALRLDPTFGPARAALEKARAAAPRN